MAYETPSEPDFGIYLRDLGFRPSIFVGISDVLKKKRALTRVYASEIGDLLFPRSQEALCAMVKVRGEQVAFESTEGFMLLLELP